MLRGSLYAHASGVNALQRLLDAVLIFSVYAVLMEMSGLGWNVVRVFPALLAVTLFALFAELQGVYRSWRLGSTGEEMRTVVTIWLFVVFTLLALAFATKTTAIFSRVMAMTWFVAVPVVLGAMRLLVRSAVRHARRKGANTRRVAVVGNNPIGHGLIEHLEAMSWSGLMVCGVFDYDVGKEACLSVGHENCRVESVDELLRKARAGEVDVVYVALPLRDEHRIDALVDSLADTTVSAYVVPDMFVAGLMNSRWVDFGGMPIVSVYETPVFGLYEWVKRVEDIVLSSLILLLTAPLMLAIALAVKLSSHGPILFRQRRYGLNGAVVEVWKFRTMKVWEDGEHVPQATRSDARNTAVGSILRRTSLDELPQFFNVLQGTMSVVGPRPHAVAHNEQYRKLIKGYMLRHKVKPGITGWAQINGWRGETDTLDKMQKRIEYDLEYIQNWSLWLDLRIILLTLAKGVAGRNAY